MLRELPPCDVIVVGAGITGLTAAGALAAAGATVAVIEARDRMGGRALSISVGGAAVDLGPGWFWPGEPAVQAMADDLGVRTFPQYLAGDALFEPDVSTVQRIDGNPIDMTSYRFRAGVQALAAGLADRLPGEALHLGEPVSAIAVTDHDVRVDARTIAGTADQVIVALPPALAVERIAFTPALPEPLRATAEGTAVWMGAAVKAVAVYDDAFWRGESLAGSAISYAGPFREFHDHSGPDGAPAAIFGFADAGRFIDVGTPEMERAFVAQLVRLFGPSAAEPRHVHVLDWSREEFTMPRAPRFTHPMAGFGAPVFQQAVAGRLHFASTETATAFAGHIEGAIRAGLDVAARALPA